jgi:hypothetical protein
MTSLQQEAAELLIKAQELLENVSKLTIESDGFIKYKTAIKSELKFLNRIQSSKDLKLAHIKCSNYNHLNAIYEIIRDHQCQVNQTIKSHFRVDVVLDDGLLWIKVKSGSNASVKGELFGYEEECSDDNDSDTEEQAELALPDPAIVKQAKQWIDASKTALTHFQSPRVLFQFVGCDEIPTLLHEQLLATGIEVGIGSFTHVPKPRFHYLSPILNLDVTTLLAMISSITHENSDIIEEAFDSKPLKIQRVSETENAILPLLMEMFDGKRLVTCEAAFIKCKSIVENIAGPKEFARCASLFGSKVHLDSKYEPLDPQPFIETGSNQYTLPWRVTVIKNQTTTILDEIPMKLQGHNEHVIGTGLFHSISTITSNTSLKRSLEKSRDFGITIHEPRGLIEQKWTRYLNN